MSEWDNKAYNIAVRAAERIKQIIKKDIPVKVIIKQNTITFETLDRGTVFKLAGNIQSYVKVCAGMPSNIHNSKKINAEGGVDMTPGQVVIPAETVTIEY